MASVLLGSSFASLLVWSGLLVGPPPLPPTPTEAVPDAPSVQEPDPPTEAVPEPQPAVPTAPAEPAAAEAGPVEAPAPSVAPPAPAPELPPGLIEASDQRWITVRAPRWRGTGLLVTAGVLYASTIAFQAGDTALCGDCAVGVIERIFLFGSMGAAAGGGVLRGHADAYDDTALRRERPDTRRALIAGAVLTGAGAVIGLVNEGMWWSCMIAGEGPYETRGQWGGGDCRYGVGRAMLDVGAGATATGLGLLSWSLTYRRDARAYQRARVLGLRPTLGRDRFGVGIGGRF